MNTTKSIVAISLEQRLDRSLTFTPVDEATLSDDWELVQGKRGSSRGITWRTKPCIAICGLKILFSKTAVKQYAILPGNYFFTLLHKGKPVLGFKKATGEISKRRN